MSVILFSFPYASASPWLEATDPYLRSDLLLLSDADQLHSFVNVYPLRWSSIGDDLNKTYTNPSIAMAQGQLVHAIDNARLSRGNRSFKLLYANNDIGNYGYGQFINDEWGGYATYESLNSHYAYRISSGYSRYNSDDEFRWNDSYVAFNSGDWLFTAGNLQRWWGQGWQHNLILGSNAKSVPELNANYLGKNALLGQWSFDILLGMPEDSSIDYHRALQMVAKPLSFWEFGISYQMWSDDLSFSSTDDQSAFNTKISLVPLGHMYHSIYAELASTNNTSQLGAWMLGWSGQFDVSGQSIRLVIEKQQRTSDAELVEWKNGDYPHDTQGENRNTYSLDNSLSAAAYIQLNNNHKLSIIYQQSDNTSTEIDNVHSTNITYRLPALSGMVHLGLEYAELDDKKENNIWTGYEFRF